MPLLSILCAQGTSPKRNVHNMHSIVAAGGTSSLFFFGSSLPTEGFQLVISCAS